MSAVDVVTEALNSILSDPRPSELVNRDRARIALDALKAAGYAVVELPEKLGEDAPYWRVLIGNEPEEVYPSPLGEIIISGSCRVDSADDARSLAAALLAAADAAEAQS